MIVSTAEQVFIYGGTHALINNVVAPNLDEVLPGWKEVGRCTIDDGFRKPVAGTSLIVALYEMMGHSMFDAAEKCARAEGIKLVRMSRKRAIAKTQLETVMLPSVQTEDALARDANTQWTTYTNRKSKAEVYYDVPTALEVDAMKTQTQTQTTSKPLVWRANKDKHSDGAGSSAFRMFSDEVRKAMRARGVSGAALALTLGVDAGEIDDMIFSGRGTVELMKRAADALGITTDMSAIWEAKELYDSGAPPEVTGTKVTGTDEWRRTFYEFDTKMRRAVRERKWTFTEFERKVHDEYVRVRGTDVGAKAFTPFFTTGEGKLGLILAICTVLKFDDQYTKRVVEEKTHSVATVQAAVGKLLHDRRVAREKAALETAAKTPKLAVVAPPSPSKPAPAPAQQADDVDKDEGELLCDENAANARLERRLRRLAKGGCVYVTDAAANTLLKLTFKGELDDVGIWRIDVDADTENK